MAWAARVQKIFLKIAKMSIVLTKIINQWRLKPIIIVYLLFVLAVLFRVYVVSDNNILFWYDQGRDFAIVKELLVGDWKIFGPRASGTYDTIYHGVLYYYLLAPLVAISDGDIQLVSYGLAFISSLGVFPVYFLTKKLSNSNISAILSSFFYALSFEAAQMGTWLSNPFFFDCNNSCFLLFFMDYFF